MEDYKTSKKKEIGIIPFVHDFSVSIPIILVNWYMYLYRLTLYLYRLHYSHYACAMPVCWCQSLFPFQQFAQQAETIFKGTDRRTDLDKAYQRLVLAVFEQIGRVAAESPKTPYQVVLFGKSDRPACKNKFITCFLGIYDSHKLDCPRFIRQYICLN